MKFTFLENFLSWFIISLFPIEPSPLQNKVERVNLERVTHFM